MKFYWGSGSPYAWRAMLALVVKEIDFESVLLSFGEGEHKTPEYLALNPRGKVPTLVDGDIVVSESLAIMSYLERKVPRVPLFGESLAEHAAIMQRLSQFEHYIIDSVTRTVRPFFVNDTDVDVSDGLAAIHRELARTETDLERLPWAAGERVSAVDLSLYPAVALLERVMGKPQLEDRGYDIAGWPRYPKLRAWKQKVEALPGFDSTYPPHWRG